jgi:hypothetical protein
MRSQIVFSTLPVCLALAACSGQQQGGENVEVKDIQIAALFTVPPTGVSCIRLTASSPKRTSTSDFGVTPGSPSFFSMHGVPMGDVVFSGAAYTDPCGFIFSGSVASWLADPVTANVSPGPATTNVTLTFRGAGNANVGVDFEGATSYTASTIAGSGTHQGSQDGFASNARFEGPNGIALDGNFLYIVDRNIDLSPTAVFPFVGMTIRRLTISTGQVETLAGDPNTIGTNDGTGNVARFSRLRGIAFSRGLLYVVDGCALRIIETSSPYNVHTLLGTPRPPPNQANWRCGTPFGSLLDLAVRPSGVNAAAVYVVDSARFTVSRIDLDLSHFPPTVNGTPTVVAGVSDISGSEDGTLSAFSPGHFLDPIGIVFPYATDDIYYVGDAGSSADFQWGLLRRVSTFEDSLVTVAGAAHGGGVIRDGLGTAALLASARRLASDGNNLFIADTNAMRRMDLASFAVTTIAGGAAAGYADGPGRSALLNGATGIALDPGGKIYFADQGNFVIRVLTP